MRQIASILLLVTAQLLTGAKFSAGQSGDPRQTSGAANSQQPGLSLTRKDEQQLQGSLKAPGVTASVNKVLLVTAPPYNAKCDGATDDQSAIQTAFNDARSNRLTIQFPAGTCKTSTIVWYGQSFFGAGQNETTILGQPGQDVFATPDSAVGLLANAYVHDLTVKVDSSVNKSAAAGGGDDTFPNRISGTAGGASNPISAANGGPPAPGGVVYGNYNGRVVGCSGSMTAGSAVFTLACGNFNQVWSGFFADQPITVSEAGPGGGTLTTTVAAVSSATTLRLAAPASTTTSAASGMIGRGIRPPWYFGNCAFAIPASSGTAMATNFNEWTFRNVFVGAANSPGTGANATCGIFEQAASNGIQFDNFNVQGLYGGIIEAPPASNANTGYFAWTPDTNSYRNVPLSWDVLPVVWYNGSHRDVQGMSIYAGNRPFLTGLWQLATPLGSSNTMYPSATFSQFYTEGWSMQSGEFERFSGVDVMTGGALDQTYAAAAYVNWMASQSTVDAQVESPLHIGGSQNTFKNVQMEPGLVSDTGFDNTIEAGIIGGDSAFERKFYVGSAPPQDPVGKLDGSFLLSGNSSTPYRSASDLMTTCRDYRFSTDRNSNSKCTNDPTGTEVSNSYFHHVGAGGFGGPFNPHWSFLMTAGPRIPLTKVFIVTQGQCEQSTSCSSVLRIYDLTNRSALLGSCNVSYGSSWTVQGGPSTAAACLVDFSAVPYGDAIAWSFNNFTGNPSAFDLAFLAFQPLNEDAVSMLRSGLFLAGRTNAVGGTPIAPGACAGGSAAVSGASSTMVVDATPAGDPGDAFLWKATVTAPGVVTVKVCNFSAGVATPRATAYNVRVLQ